MSIQPNTNTQQPGFERFGRFDPPESRLNVIIVGAGIAGVALAGLLGHSGHKKVTVLEAAPSIAEVGAGLACAPNVTRLIKHWGLSDKILKHSTALKATNIVRWQNGELLCSASLTGAQDRYGAPHYVLHRADLFATLLEWAQEVADLRVNSMVVDVDFDTPSVTLMDGTVLSADVIIGADGIKSICRRIMSKRLGMVDQTVPTGDATFRALLPIDKIEDAELAEFVRREESTRWIGKGGHIQAYPVRNGSLYNMVMVHPDTGFTDEPWTVRASKAKILEHFGDWDVSRLGKLIQQIPDDNIMEWRLCEHSPLPTWTFGKVVLIGDACHPMLPYVGQGAAQCLEDAAVLHLTLNRIQTSTPGNIELLLKVYEAVRKPRAEQVVSISRTNGPPLHLPDGPEQQVRDNQFRAVAAGNKNPDLFANLEVQGFLLDYDPEKDFLDNSENLIREALEKHNGQVAKGSNP